MTAALMIIAISVCQTLMLTGCGVNLQDLFFGFLSSIDYESDEDAIKANLEKLTERLESKDHDEIKALFAPSKVAYITDFDDDVTELSEYFVGDFVSYDYTYSATKDVLEGDKKKWLYISANIKTTSETYFFGMNWCNEDTANADNVGIWALFVFNYAEHSPNDYSFYDDFSDDDYGIHIIRT